jgi:hypothetical protein
MNRSLLVILAGVLFVSATFGLIETSGIDAKALDPTAVF